MELVLGMFFLFFSNVNVKFIKLRKLTYRSYHIAKTLPTNSRIEFINKKEFVKAILNANFITFVIHLATLEMMLIHLSRIFQV